MAVLFFHNKNISCRLPYLLLLAASLHLPTFAQMSQTPVVLPPQPLPNVLFIWGNSPQMGLTEAIPNHEQWGISTFTDTMGNPRITTKHDQQAYYSASFNKLYYNPDITYPKPPIPLAYQTNERNITDIKKVPIDPFNLGSETIDITARCQPQDDHLLPAYPVGKNYTYAAYLPEHNLLRKIDLEIKCKRQNSGRHAYYAFYYHWKGQGQGQPDGSLAQETDTHYERVDIMPEKTEFIKSLISQRTDCNHKDYCTYNEEIQNFANWFAYYRSRLNTTKTVIGLALKDIVNKINAGLMSVNMRGNSTFNIHFKPVQALPQRDIEKLVESFYDVNTQLESGENNTNKDFLNEGLYKGGESFKRIPRDSIFHSCQRNAIILATDHANRSLDEPTIRPNNIGNQDSSIPSFTATIQYGPLKEKSVEGSTFPYPFYDIYHTTNTLADMTMYLWSKPLLGNSVINVKPTHRDPATWQHITTYTIGMAMDGTLKYQPDYETAPTGDYRDLLNGTKNWPKPEPDHPSNVDDLWHAAVNGHGKYFSVKSPEELKHAIAEILTDITSQPSAGKRIIYNNPLTSGNKYAYVASYDSKHWSGHLKAFNQINGINISRIPVWEATIPQPAIRAIFTSNSQGKFSFKWTSLPPNMQSLLTLEAVNYLRGDTTYEGNAGGLYSFRKRESPLGDIVNSLPFYTHATDFHYNKLPTNQGGSDYLAFLQHKKNRHPLLFVGANDGMIHIFDAQTGEEKMAYIPQAVHDDLLELTKPNYSHQFYVDGPIVEGDAWIHNEWKNIVVVANGAGKPGLTAFDATNPSSFNKNMILWEVNQDRANFADLGHIIGEPTLGKLRNGEWAVLTGNGYFNTTQKNLLYSTQKVEKTSKKYQPMFLFL